MAERERVLITGSSGFIGSALARALSPHFDVLGLDRDYPKERIPGVTYFALDLTSEDELAKVLEGIARDRGSVLHSVIHLVAYYSFSGKEDPRYKSVTLDGTRFLLRHLRQNFSVEQFIFSSSMLVYAPNPKGEKIQEDSPLAPSWPYPRSKVEAEAILGEEQGRIPILNLRIAGVYDDFCHSPTISHQIQRIFEGQLTSVPFPGDPSAGQAFLHLEDLVEALVLFIQKRRSLGSFETFLLGEEDVMSFEEVQKEVGFIIRKKPWPTIRVPRWMASAGARVMEKLPFMREPFVKPWMVPHSDERFELDLTKTRSFLGWSPKRSLRGTLPVMLEKLLAAPKKWYAINKIPEPFYRPVETVDGDGERNLFFACLFNVFLGLWLISNPFGFGEVESGERLSEIISGSLVAIFGVISLAPTLRWFRWINAALGLWVLTSPLIFFTRSEGAYSNDTLIGGLILLASVYLPSSQKERSSLGAPPGWTYNPSTAGQRIPIMVLAFLGFLFSRYLASFQLEHIPNAWDPFFGNGTERVLTSSVSKAFPVSDAGLGALTYLLDVIAATVGGRSRWRTAPWAVILFGLMIIPAGVTSITLIMLQPISVGAWCTLCLITAFIMLLMVPPAVDEVLASVQFLHRVRKEGKPFWPIFWLGSEDEISMTEKAIPKKGTVAHIYLSVVLGIWLMFSPAIFGIQGIAADNIYIVASLITTFSVIALSEAARLVRLFNLPLAIWLATSAWFLGDMTELAQIHSLGVGFLLMFLDLPFGKRAHTFGNVDKVIHWSPIRRSYAGHD